MKENFKKIGLIILIIVLALLVMYYIYFKVPEFKIISTYYNEQDNKLVNVYFKFGINKIRWTVVPDKEVVVEYMQGANNGYALKYYYKNGKAYFDLFKDEKFIKNLKTI